MATLNLPGFTMGLPILLFTTPIVPNSSYSSHAIPLCQENQTNPNPSHSSLVESSPPPSSSSSESTTTSSQKPRMNKGKNQKRKKKKGGKPLAFTSQTMGKKPLASTTEVGINQSTTSSQASGTHIVEKTKKIGPKPRFACNLCKGDHHTHLFPFIP